MQRTRRSWITAVTASAFAAALSAGALAADPPGKGVTINIGYFPVVSPVPIMRVRPMTMVVMRALLVTSSGQRYWFQP